MSTYAQIKIITLLNLFYKAKHHKLLVVLNTSISASIELYSKWTCEDHQQMGIYIFHQNTSSEVLPFINGSIAWCFLNTNMKILNG